MIDAATKLKPRTVIGTSVVLMNVLFGKMLLITGTGETVTSKFIAAEVPPPGVGVTTVTDAGPTAAMSAAGICAVSWVELTNVVGRAAPFQRTSEPCTKFDPVAVNVKIGPPAVAAFGAIAVTMGAANCTGTAIALEEPPP